MLTVIISVLFLTLHHVSLTDAAAAVVCSDDEALCGSTCFDPDSKTCCGGKTIIDFRISSRMGCCDGNMYDKTQQTCCGSRLIGGSEVGLGETGSINERCCGGSVVYDAKTEQCCAGVVNPRMIFIGSETSDGGRQETDSQCCGNATYDESTQECCEYDLDPARFFSVRTRLPGHNYRCCGPRVIDIASEDCPEHGLVGLVEMDDDDDDNNNNNNGESMLACGPSGDAYNPLHQICCDGVLHKRFDRSTGCCGSTTYDMAHSVCCFGDYVISYTTGNEVCCRHASHGYVDSATHTCCGGIPHEKLLRADGSSVHACCGDSSINTRFQSCCHNTDMTTASPFDRDLQKCCGGHVIPVDVECCANRWPVTAGSVCCPRSGIVIRRHHGDNSCCESRFHLSSQQTNRTSYNTATEVCLNGLVTPRRSVATCAGDVYDKRTQTCCSGVLFDDKPQADHTCVDGVPISNRTHCTSGREHRCGSECYSETTHLCCSSNEGESVRRGHRPQQPILIARRNANNACCGTNIYDARRQTCVDGNVRSAATGRRRLRVRPSFQSATNRRANIEDRSTSGPAATRDTTFLTR